MKKFKKILIFIVLSFIAIYFIFYDRKILEGHGGGGVRGGIRTGGNFRTVGAFGRGNEVLNRGIGYGRGLGATDVDYGLGRYYVNNNYYDLGYYSTPFFY